MPKKRKSKLTSKKGRYVDGRCRKKTPVRVTTVPSKFSSVIEILTIIYTFLIKLPYETNI